MTIPEWDLNRVIPPIRPGTPKDGEHQQGNRSPYPTTLVEFVERFATSPERVRLIDGYLAYRAALHQAGIQRGFQWVDGSFVEHVEQRHFDPGMPNDIDVVTFFFPPEEHAIDYVALFTPELTKDTFSVDAYGFQLGVALTPARAELIGYWHGMWSHRRVDLRWKGFVRIDLNPNEDAIASRASEFVDSTENDNEV